MRQMINPLTGKFDVVGVVEGDLPTEGSSSWMEPYSGVAVPGETPNVLDEGCTRMWLDTSEGRVYLVNYFNGIYRQTELTART